MDPNMDPMMLLWIALAIIAVVVIVALLVRSAGKKRSERNRADAEQLRTRAHAQDHDLRDRSARADEADAAARRARAEAEAKAAEAEAKAAEADAKAAEADRLQVEADKRGEQRDELLHRREDQLREADKLDPDVRTDKEGRRLDGGRTVEDDRAEWDRPHDDTRRGARAAVASAPAAQDPRPEPHESDRGHVPADPDDRRLADREDHHDDERVAGDPPEEVGLRQDRVLDGGDDPHRADEPRPDRGHDDSSAPAPVRDQTDQHASPRDDRGVLTRVEDADEDVRRTGDRGDGGRENGDRRRDEATTPETRAARGDEVPDDGGHQDEEQVGEEGRRGGGSTAIGSGTSLPGGDDPVDDTPHADRSPDAEGTGRLRRVYPENDEGTPPTPQR